MKKIIIDDSGSSCDYIYPDQWKELVCFEFEENIVITGNTRMKRRDRSILVGRISVHFKGLRISRTR